MPSDDILLDTEDKMDKAVDYFRKELRGIRTGRASPALVEHLKVEYYGSPTDLRQLASIAAPEPSLLVIKPFDPSGIKDIERAILASELGITPMSDGKLIRLPIPSLSVERRKQLANQLKKMAEAARVAIRNLRRDANKLVDQEKEGGEMPEDAAATCKDEVQKLTDTYGKQVDTLLDEKTNEIMES
jgi:ribosome recycling factor